MPVQRVPVGRVDDFPEGASRVVAWGALRIAVFRVGGRFVAVKDVCPHAGVPLHDGVVCDGAVTCRNHGWRFDLATGACLNQPGRRVSSFEVEVEGGVVYVRI